MLKVKYFAYGSNILHERLKNRVETFTEKLEPGIPYTLENYSLIFNVGGFAGNYAFANIIPNPGLKVEGLLYDLTPEQFDTLDRYETLYEKYFFPINETTIGCVYIGKNRNISRKACRPSLDYLNTIINGCKQANLTETYNALVNYKSRNYKLKRNKHSII